MRDKGLIIAGLVVFLVLITFPMWYNSATGTTSEAPVLKKAVRGETCVEPVDYMRASHMDLLIEWRDDVVRNGNRTFVSTDGASHEMSLAGTCLGCHDSKADFCDKCHNYVGVDPYCWDCHVDPALVGKAVASSAAPAATGGALPKGVEHAHR